jgi:hypothetical protein
MTQLLTYVRRTSSTCFQDVLLLWLNCLMTTRAGDIGMHGSLVCANADAGAASDSRWHSTAVS